MVSVKKMQIAADKILSGFVLKFTFSVISYPVTLNIKHCDLSSGGQNQIAIRFKSRFEAHCDSIQAQKDLI